MTSKVVIIIIILMALTDVEICIRTQGSQFSPPTSVVYSVTHRYEAMVVSISAM